MLIKELEDGLVESKHEEETAQKDYERLMSNSQATRAQNVDSITAKEAAKADLSNVKNTIAQLHADCDFLIENFDLRKSARANEVDSLKNAKGVLSGASFS